MERLRRENEQFRILSASVRDAIIVMDGAKRITFWNDAAERLFGFKRTEALGRDPHDFIAPPEYRARFEKAFPRWLETGQGEAVGKTFELTARRRDGQQFPIEISLSTAKVGDIRLAIAVIRDVTRRQKAEEELKYRNIILATQHEVSPDGILIVDAEGRIQSCNRKFIDMWSIPPGVIESGSDKQAVDSVLDKLESPGEFTERVRFLYEHHHEESRDEIRLKDGRILERFSAPMFGPDGAYYGRVWNFRDVTDRARSERRIQAANEQLSILVRKLEERNIQSGILGELREFLQGCPTTAEIGPIIELSMLKLFPDSEGALLLLSPSRTDLETAVRWGDYPEDIEENVFSPDKCWALRKGGPYILEEPVKGLFCPHLKIRPSSGYVCLPLMAKGDVLGLLHIRRRAGVPGEAARTLSGLKEISSALAELLSLSISNIRLRETLSSQSIRDPLTGLFNRRYMEESFQKEIHRAGRKKEGIGIIMIDIDFFKRFNDLNGHAAGDAALSEVAGFLRNRVRAGDTVCRYGGEEFTLILPECGLEAARERAERILNEIKEMHVVYNGRGLGSLTLSMGVAAFPAHGTTPEDLLRAADAALYRAKREGRNRVVLA